MIVAISAFAPDHLRAERATAFDLNRADPILTLARCLFSTLLYADILGCQYGAREPGRATTKRRDFYRICAIHGGTVKTLGSGRREPQLPRCERAGRPAPDAASSPSGPGVPMLKAGRR